MCFSFLYPKQNSWHHNGHPRRKEIAAPEYIAKHSFGPVHIRYVYTHHPWTGVLYARCPLAAPAATVSVASRGNSEMSPFTFLRYTSVLLSIYETESIIVTTPRNSQHGGPLAGSVDAHPAVTLAPLIFSVPLETFTRLQGWYFLFLVRKNAFFSRNFKSIRSAPLSVKMIFAQVTQGITCCNRQPAGDGPWRRSFCIRVVPELFRDRK